MPLYLAIDAGGTKTTCLLAEDAGPDTRVLASASTGSVKLMRVPEEEATARLQAMLHELAAQAGVSLSRVTRTCVGLAGLSSPAARAWASQLIPTLVGGELLLLGDEEIALDAAFARGPGILVIAGTGSNVLGRNPAGQLFSAGGWGPVLGDEGSGFWIGLEAIHAALRALDRHEPGRTEPGALANPSCLLREIQLHWQLDSLPALVALANQRNSVRRPSPDFAGLAPVVARCAAQGDHLAATILTRAGEELAAQVTLVARKMSSSAGEPLAIAYTGSVLTHIAPVREVMFARLALALPAATLHPTPVDPLQGALLRARHG